MRVVFFGTPAWAVPALETLARSGRHEVAGVVTAPDAPQGRSRAPVAPPVKDAAAALGIEPVLQPATLKGDAARAPILALAPDALAVVAYGRILPGRLLDAPPRGAVNVHFSLLPRHRGAAPVQYAIRCGDPVTGVTTMLMDRGLDTGARLRAWPTPIGPRETASALGARLAEAGATLLLETLDALARGALVPDPQPEAGVTWAPPLRKDEGRVDFAAPAAEIDRLVRAFDPWPPVVCEGARGTLQLVETRPVDARSDAAPGTVLGRAEDGLDVAAGGGSVLRLLRVKPAGGRVMTGAAALAGRWLAPGDRLGTPPGGA